jgi:acetoin utilization protein AcuC
LGVRLPLRVCITYHEKFSQYDLGVNHPYRGDRFIKAKNFLDEKGLSKLPNVFFIEPKPATREKLLKIHTKEYVDQTYRLAELGRPYDIDTPVSSSILEALLFIIGGVTEAGNTVLEGQADRAVGLGGGFHHAGRDYGGGFCIFNDIAILVEHLREKHGVKRILVLDYDVHFGNGTSDIYYRDPNVLFISLHQNPLTIYPGRGFIDEVGEGKGEGYNVNVPLPIRTGEESYLYALKEIFPTLAEEFKPEIILANGGSDAHFADHLGSLGLTAKGFFEIARIIGETSQKVCGGKVVLLIGSGYNSKVLPYCWYALAAGITEPAKTKDTIEDYYPAPHDPWQNQQQVEDVLRDLNRILKKYWKCF